MREFAYFGQIPWIIAHGPRPKNDKLWPIQILDLNTSFERSLSKLSENHKKFEIGSTVLKLWLLKDVQLHVQKFTVLEDQLNYKQYIVNCELYVQYLEKLKIKLLYNKNTPWSIELYICEPTHFVRYNIVDVYIIILTSTVLHCGETLASVPHTSTRFVVMGICLYTRMWF